MLDIDPEASSIARELRRLADSLEREAEAIPSGSPRAQALKTDARTFRIAARYIKELEKGIRDFREYQDFGDSPVA